MGLAIGRLLQGPSSPLMDDEPQIGPGELVSQVRRLLETGRKLLRRWAALPHEVEQFLVANASDSDDNKRQG